MKLKFLLAHIILFQLFFSQLRAQDEKAKIDSLNSLPIDVILSDISGNIKLFSQNLEKCKQLAYQSGEAKTLSILGTLNYLKGNYDRSTDLFLQAIRLLEESDNSELLADVYGDFGYQLKRRDLSKAHFYMRKAINLAEKNNNINSLTKLYDNYGVLKEMESNYDSAAAYYRKSLDMKKQINDSIGIPYSLNNLAGINALTGNYQEAIKLLQQSDEYRNKEKGNYGRLENLAFYGDLYFSMGQTDSAIVKYNLCISNQYANEHKYLVRYCYEQLTKIYENRKDYHRAYDSFKKFTEYKDSLVNTETNSKIAELEINYETEKKDRQLAEDKFEIQKRTDQIIFLAGTVMLLSLLSIWIYRSQKLKRERIKNELELKNKIEQAEYERKMSDEKLRISRELHDNIGSHITFMISSLDNISYTEKNNNLTPKLISLSKFGRDTMKELRNTIWAMNLEDGDLDQLILKLNGYKKQLSENLDNISVDINNEMKNACKLSSMQSLNIYRIVQEAIQNSLKHSGATTIIITFRECDNGFILIIKDDGLGFNTGDFQSGNGIKNMKQRCIEAGGVFLISSGSKGTSISCTFSFN